MGGVGRRWVAQFTVEPQAQLCTLPSSGRNGASSGLRAVACEDKRRDVSELLEVLPAQMVEEEAPDFASVRRCRLRDGCKARGGEFDVDSP